MRNYSERSTGSVMLRALMVIGLLFAIWIISCSNALADDGSLDMKNAEQLNLGSEKSVHASSSNEYYCKTFKFNTTAADSYFMVTLRNSTIENSMEFILYDSSGIRVDDFSADYIRTHEEKYVYDKLNTNSTYYVLVKYWANEGEYSGDYKILVNEIKDDAGNNSYLAVNRAPGVINGICEVQKDTDWYKITARRSGNHKIVVENPNSGYLDYAIFDSNVISKESGTAYGNRTIESEIVLKSGECFYIKINNGYSSNQKYTIRITEPSIAPSKVALKKIKAGKGSLTVKYKAAKRTSFYQIAYRTKSSKWKLKKATGLSKKIKKLARKKKYMVKVRGVRLYGGTKYYGAWSKVKKAKTK